MKALNMITWLLIIIGGINWGLIGLMEFNLVDTIFGVGSPIAKIVYILVGVSAVYQLIPFAKCCQAGGGANGCCS